MSARTEQARTPRWSWLILVLGVVASCGWSWAQTVPVYVAEWGSFGSGAGDFNAPAGIAVDSHGEVYVADARNHRIQKFDANGTFLTAWGSLGSGVGEMWHPLGLAVDSADRVYVVDSANSRIQIFDRTGAYLDHWGSVTSQPADGEFFWPSGVAVSSQDQVYVTDQGSLDRIWGHNVQVFEATGDFLYRWGVSGTGVGNFVFPSGIAIDASDAVYVADTGNHRIQKSDALGNFVQAFGGFGTGAGQLNQPRGLAVDAAGALYVADWANHRVQVFDATGIATVSWGVAGTGGGEFLFPFFVAVDAAGNVFVSDTLNHRVQKFSFGRQIDVVVKPGGGTPSVNLRSNGLLKVAVLSDASFDATEIDPLTVRLGPAGAGIFHAQGHFDDLDGDGYLDLLLHFRIQDLGVDCGDTSMTFSAVTMSGEAVAATVSIVTTGCP